jgi:radical SAM protein with 4Fe4S-binding SPASM domain
MCYPVLKENVRFRAEAECVVWVDRESERVGYITPFTALVMALCNGLRTIEDITGFVCDAFGVAHERARDEVASVLEAHKEHIRICAIPTPTTHRTDPTQFVYKSTLGSECMRSYATRAGWPTFSGPLTAVLCVTRRCSFRCGYCYKGGPRDAGNELSAHELLDCVQQLASFPVFRCFVSGGEPFLRDDTTTVLRALVSADIYPYVSTNGFHVTQRLAGELASIPLPTIQVSLDSSLPEVVDRLSGVHDALPRVLEGIRYLLAAGLHVRTKCVLTSLNVEEVESYVRFCWDLGVQYVGFSNYFPGCEGSHIRNWLVPGSRLAEISEMSRQLQSEYEGRMFVEIVHPYEAWERGEVVVCGAGITTLTVFPNGSVGMCELLEDDPELIIGDVRRDDLRSIWHSARAEQLRRLAPGRARGACASCPELLYCRTGCWSMSHVCYGNSFTPDPRCWNAVPVPDYPINYSAACLGTP